jgi:hypothetical protein
MGQNKVGDESAQLLVGERTLGGIGGENGWVLCRAKTVEERGDLRRLYDAVSHPTT